MPVETGVSSRTKEPPAPANFHGSLASLKDRVAARILDALAVGCLSLLTMTSLGDLPRDLVGIRLLAITGVLVSAAYEVILVGTWGQTFGKRIMGIMIVDFPSGGAVGYRSAAVRYLILAVSPLGIIAFARAKRDVLQRGLHDKAAGTVVVRSPAQSAAPSART